MSSSVRALIWLAALGSCAPVLLELARDFLASGGPEPAVLVKGCLGIGPGLVLIALVGRLVLSVLPAGDPGSHRPAALAETWAASHFLGVVALGLQLDLYRVVGLPTGLGMMLGPWALLGVGRLGTLPAAPRPRRDLAHEPTGWLARLALALAVGAAFLPLLLWSSPVVSGPAASERHALVNFLADVGPYRFRLDAAPLSAFTWPCLLVLLSGALARGRRSPLGRRLLLLVPALLPFALSAVGRDPTVTQLPLFFGAGSCFLVPWLRRGDRRAAVLSAIGFAACGLVSPAGLLLGAAGLAGIWVATPAASKIFVGWVAGVSAGAIALPGVLTGDFPFFLRRVVWDLARALTRSPHRTGYWTLRDLLGAGNDPSQWGYGWLLFALLVPTYAAVWLLRLRRQQHVAGIAPPGREVWALIAIGALAGGLQVALAAWVYAVADAPWISGPDAAAALFTLTPTVFLVAGLILLRQERPRASLAGVRNG